MMRLRDVVASHRQLGACLVFFAVLATASSQSCTDQSYNACTADFTNGDPANAMIPWYSVAVLTDICRRLPVFVQCMNKMISNCSTLQQLIYQGYIDGYTYLCNTGYLDYENFQPNCFTIPGVQAGGSWCGKQYGSQLSTLISNMTRNPNFNLDICTASYTYMTCIRKLLVPLCDTGAANWQQTFDLKQLCPFVSLGLNCGQFQSLCAGLSTTVKPNSAPSTSISAWAIILIVCIAVFLFLLIFGVVLLVICIKKKRRHDKPNPVASSAYGDGVQFDNFGRGTRIDLPPPYPGPFNYQGLFDSPTTIAPNEGIPTSTTPAILPGEAATIDEAMGDASEVGAYAGRFGDEEKVMDEGFFVPDAVEMDAKLDDAIPPPPSGNRLYRKHETKGFFPGDAHEQNGAGSMSPSVTSTSGAFGPHSHLNHHGMWTNIHHPRHEAPVAKSVRSKSLEGQLYTTGLQESTFDRVPGAADEGPFTIDGIRDIQNFHKFRGGVSDGGDSATSGLASMTSSSAQSANLFTRQLSNSTPMSISMTSSSSNYDNDLSHSTEIDYY